MGIKYNIHPNAPRVRALVDKAQAMGQDRDRRFSDTDIHDTIIGGLIAIVSELEAAQAQTTAAAERAKSDAAKEAMAFRSAEAGGGR